MSSDDSTSERQHADETPSERESAGPSPERESTGTRTETGVDLDADAVTEDEGSRWAGYALAGLLVVVFLVGLLRLVYPAATGLLIGALLALFGVLVGVLAFRERSR